MIRLEMPAEYSISAHLERTQGDAFDIDRNDIRVRPPVVRLTGSLAVFQVARECLQSPFPQDGLNESSLSLLTDEVDAAAASAEARKQPQALTLNELKINALGRAVYTRARELALPDQSLAAADYPASDPRIVAHLLKGLGLAVSAFRADSEVNEAFQTFSRQRPSRSVKALRRALEGPAAVFLA